MISKIVLTLNILCLLCCWAQIPFEVNEGESRNPLIQGLDLPFVPEDFRASPKGVIFDKDDFVSLLPNADEEALTTAILALLIESQRTRANTTKVYNKIDLSYVGMARLGGRPGQSAHFAASVKVHVCDRTLTTCHFEECDLDLDQKDQADPHNYRPIFSLHSKECQRLDSWCHYCNTFDDLDRLVQGPESCKTVDLPMKKNCNAKFGDLSVMEKWACKSVYTIVAGQSEAIAKDCIAVPHNETGSPTTGLVCQSLDKSDYEVQCTCYQGSGCNREDVFPVQELFFDSGNDSSLVDEVNRSIRQLRADLKRTFQRYTNHQQHHDRIHHDEDDANVVDI